MRLFLTMPRITISYRRDDSLDITGRIFDRLAGHFGREAVFRDIDSIPLGADFRRHIDRVLGESDIILAIVGPRWIGPNNEQLRLASSADPVRLEIETALRKDKPVIPVLVDGVPGDAEKECRALVHRGLALPAYDQCLKASHLFNLLDARGAISVTERTAYILRVRALANACCEAWLVGPISVD